jgi:hypothetical protein
VLAKKLLGSSCKKILIEPSLAKKFAAQLPTETDIDTALLGRLPYGLSQKTEAPLSFTTKPRSDVCLDTCILFDDVGQST